MIKMSLQNVQSLIKQKCPTILSRDQKFEIHHIFGQEMVNFSHIIVK